MPESPTEVDIGRDLYYFHCMPCHGDQGQGLTDEWRQVWPEDHQNCWARGCHTGREGEEGFPIPRAVPAVSGSPLVAAGLEEPESLHAFLRWSHPPQRPGALSDEECGALTAFVLSEHGQQEHRVASDGVAAAGIASAILLGGGLSALFICKQKRESP